MGEPTEREFLEGLRYEDKFPSTPVDQEAVEGCDSCGRQGALVFSPPHNAHFCPACLSRETGQEVVERALDEWVVRRLGMDLSPLSIKEGAEQIIEAAGLLSPAQPELTREESVERALKRLDEDIRDRLIAFDGGPMLMSWQEAHRHHADEPYIGCPFCQDKFVLRAALSPVGRGEKDASVYERPGACGPEETRRG